MAKIRQNKDQEMALLSIRAKLEAISKINSALDVEGPFSLSVRVGKGGSAVQLDEALTGKVKALYRAQKERLAKDIFQLAKKNEIELDDTDLAIINA